MKLCRKREPSTVAVLITNGVSCTIAYRLARTLFVKPGDVLRLVTCVAHTGLQQEAIIRLKTLVDKDDLEGTIFDVVVQRGEESYTDAMSRFLDEVPSLDLIIMGSTSLCIPQEGLGSSCVGSLQSSQQMLNRSHCPRVGGQAHVQLPHGTDLLRIHLAQHGANALPQLFPVHSGMPSSPAIGPLSSPRSSSILAPLLTPRGGFESSGALSSALTSLSYAPGPTGLRRRASSDTGEFSSVGAAKSAASWTYGSSFGLGASTSGAIGNLDLRLISSIRSAPLLVVKTNSRLATVLTHIQQQVQQLQRKRQEVLMMQGAAEAEAAAASKVEKTTKRGRNCGLISVSATSAHISNDESTPVHHSVVLEPGVKGGAFSSNSPSQIMPARLQTDAHETSGRETASSEPKAHEAPAAGPALGNILPPLSHRRTSDATCSTQAVVSSSKVVQVRTTALGPTVPGLNVLVELQPSCRYMLDWLFLHLRPERDTVLLAACRAAETSGHLRQSTLRMLGSFAAQCSCNGFSPKERLAYSGAAGLELPAAATKEGADILVMQSPLCKGLSEALTQVLLRAKSCVLIWPAVWNERHREERSRRPFSSLGPPVPASQDPFLPDRESPRRLDTSARPPSGVVGQEAKKDIHVEVLEEDLHVVDKAPRVPGRTFNKEQGSSWNRRSVRKATAPSFSARPGGGGAPNCGAHAHAHATPSPAPMSISALDLASVGGAKMQGMVQADTGGPVPVPIRSPSFDRSTFSRPITREGGLGTSIVREKGWQVHIQTPEKKPVRPLHGRRANPPWGMAGEESSTSPRGLKESQTRPFPNGGLDGGDQRMVKDQDYALGYKKVADAMRKMSLVGATASLQSDVPFNTQRNDVGGQVSARREGTSRYKNESALLEADVVDDERVAAANRAAARAIASVNDAAAAAAAKVAPRSRYS